MPERLARGAGIARIVLDAQHGLSVPKPPSPEKITRP